MAQTNKAAANAAKKIAKTEKTDRRYAHFDARNAARLPHQPADPLRMMRVGEVATLLQLHPITVFKWSRTGKFPRPVQLGPQTVVWRATDVAAWIEAKAAKANGEAAE
jgi:prophage regulatory protein